MKKKNVLILLCLMLLAACSSATNSENLADSAWLLDSMSGYSDLGPVEVSLNFGEDGSIGGVGGCNSYGGSYSITGENEIAFSQIFSTLMACLENDASDIEAAYFAALNSASSFSLDFEFLRIQSDSGELVFRLAP